MQIPRQRDLDNTRIDRVGAVQDRVLTLRCAGEAGNSRPSQGLVPHGAYHERREVARSMAEIAPDPPGWLTALRFDIDTEGGCAAWIEAELPAPNLVIVNPCNGHAHLIYLLGAWVQTDFRRPSPPIK